VIVELDLLTRGYRTLRPTVVGRYDLAVDDGSGTFKRVQSKCGRWDVRGREATLKASWDTPYTTDEVDVIAVVDPTSETVYYVKVSDLVEGTTSITIRFVKASRETTSFDGNECMTWPYERSETNE
jgi:hypothetical protein